MFGRDSFKTLLAAGAMALMAGGAQAATFSFDGASDVNNAVDNAIAEAQMSVEVNAGVDDLVVFRFLNIGAAASSIVQVYWDDNDSLLDEKIAIVSPLGVSFSWDATPPNSPEPNQVSPSFAADASADANTPNKVGNGVNPGELVSFIFRILGGKSYSDVLASITAGDLRMAIHVQGFASGGSETLVNVPGLPPSSVPLPAAGFLLIGALGGLAALRRRRRVA